MPGCSVDHTGNRSAMTSSALVTTVKCPYVVERLSLLTSKTAVHHWYGSTPGVRVSGGHWVRDACTGNRFARGTPQRLLMSPSSKWCNVDQRSCNFRGSTAFVQRPKHVVMSSDLVGVAAKEFARGVC